MALKMLLDLPKRLETSRLIVRAYQPGDGAMYFATGQRNRDHLQRFEAGNCILQPANAEEAEALVRELAAHWDLRSYFFFGAFEKVSGDFAAQVYVGPVDWTTPEFEVGYFADKDKEGCGYVTEAVRAVLGFIFNHLKAHRASLTCSDANIRSWKVAERCGFIREAHFRENQREPDGSYSGTLVYSLLRDAYEALYGDDIR